MFKLSKQEKTNLLYLSTVLELSDSAGQYGFVRYRSTYRRLQAYASKERGIVLKRPACILDDRTPKKLRVPTISIDNGWVVQPIVRKTDLKLAVEIVRRRAKPYQKYKIYPDIHTGNVGWYNGKAVLFDW